MVVPEGYQQVETLYESDKSVVTRAAKNYAQDTVVIKTHKDPYPSTKALIRLHHEYETIKKLNANQIENVVTALDISSRQKQCYIILEDIQGEQAWIRRIPHDTGVRLHGVVCTLAFDRQGPAQQLESGTDAT